MKAHLIECIDDETGEVWYNLVMVDKNMPGVVSHVAVAQTLSEVKILELVCKNLNTFLGE